MKLKICVFLVFCLFLVNSSYVREINQFVKDNIHKDEVICVDCHYYDRVSVLDVGDLFKFDGENNVY